MILYRKIVASGNSSRASTEVWRIRFACFRQRKSSADKYRASNLIGGWRIKSKVLAAWQIHAALRPSNFFFPTTSLRFNLDISTLSRTLKNPHAHQKSPHLTPTTKPLTSFRDFSSHQHLPPQLQPPSTTKNGQLPSLNIRNRTRQSKLQFLLQNRSLSPRRPLFQETCQTLLLPNHTASKPIPKSPIRS